MKKGPGIIRGLFFVVWEKTAETKRLIFFSKSIQPRVDCMSITTHYDSHLRHDLEIVASTPLYREDEITLDSHLIHLQPSWSDLRDCEHKGLMLNQYRLPVLGPW